MVLGSIERLRKSRVGLILWDHKPITLGLASLCYVQVSVLC